MCTPEFIDGARSPLYLWYLSVIVVAGVAWGALAEWFDAEPNACGSHPRGFDRPQLHSPLSRLMLLATVARFSAYRQQLP
jgi:hypothetical protein